MNRPIPSVLDVDMVLELFREEDGSVLLAEPNFEVELRVALRVTIQFGLTLEVVGSDPASHSFNISMIRDDIRSAIEFFEHVESIAVGLLGTKQRNWVWPGAFTWPDFTTEFAKELERLRAPAIPLVERYSAMVRLIRLQLAFWALTWGYSASGYVV